MKSVPLPVGALVRRLSGLPLSAVTGHTHAAMERQRDKMFSPDYFLV